jgi:DNA-binding LacI/PurR family transcriptional regulator
MATMHEVARRAGVSTATVSRVLNASPQMPIAPETRRRVEAAMQELGYRPHLGAQTLASRRSRQIGILLENRPERRYTHPLAWEFVLGINEGLQSSGYISSLVRVMDVQETAGAADLSSKALHSQLFDGVIAISVLPPAAQSRVEELFPSTIWLDSNVWRDERCIRRNEYEAGCQGVRAVAKAGFEEVFYLAPWEGHTHYSANERTRGVRQMARQLKLQLHEYSIPEDTDAYHHFNAIEKRFKPGAAWIIDGTYTMHTLLLNISSSHWKIGKDLFMLCLDDHFHETAYHWEHVACVTFDRFDMGRQAAEMTLELLGGSEQNCESRLIAGQFRSGVTFPFE